MNFVLIIVDCSLVDLIFSMTVDKGKWFHKLHQLQKRLYRSKKNPGHTSDLKYNLRLKRINEIKKKLSNI